MRDWFGTLRVRHRRRLGARWNILRWKTNTTVGFSRRVAISVYFEPICMNLIDVDSYKWDERRSEIYLPMHVAPRHQEFTKFIQALSIQKSTGHPSNSDILRPPSLRPVIFERLYILRHRNILHQSFSKAVVMFLLRCPIRYMRARWCNNSLDIFGPLERPGKDVDNHIFQKVYQIESNPGLPNERGKTKLKNALSESFPEWKAEQNLVAPWQELCQEVKNTTPCVFIDQLSFSESWWKCWLHYRRRDIHLVASWQSMIWLHYALDMD